MSDKPFVQEIYVLPDNNGMPCPFSGKVPLDHIVVGAINKGKNEYSSVHKIRFLKRLRDLL